MPDDLVQDALRRIAILERKIADMIVEGVVVAVQPKPYRVKVDYGEEGNPLHTGWLPVAPFRAGMADSWWPLDVGEGVTIISVDGVLEHGRVFPSRYTEDNLPSSENLNECQLNFGGGVCLHFNRETGKVFLKAPTEIFLDSNVRISKDLFVGGKVDITKDLAVGGVSKASDHLSGEQGVSSANHDHDLLAGGKTKKANPS